MNGTIEDAVLGIGVDIVETDRLRQTIERWRDRFIRRVFCPAERRYCESARVPWRHYAGRFAVKEAVSKAFGTGIGAQIGWREIEVVRDATTGAPAVRLRGGARRLARQHGVERILVSLSHGRAYAVGQAMICGRGPSR